MFEFFSFPFLGRCGLGYLFKMRARGPGRHGVKMKAGGRGVRAGVGRMMMVLMVIHSVPYGRLTQTHSQAACLGPQKPPAVRGRGG